MVVKENSDSNKVEAKWIGCHDPSVVVPNLVHKKVYFYSKCLVGAHRLSIGDYVLVYNIDAAEPDTVEGCDIAKIVQFYELCEMSDKDPCRAIVQWYSRPEYIPHKEFDSDSICIDFSCELIEEHRPYDSDISLAAIFRKCSVICGLPEDSAAGLLKQCNKNSNSSCPMFVCRYKFIKDKKSYRLVPLQLSNEDPENTGPNATVKVSHRRKSGLVKTPRSSKRDKPATEVCSARKPKAANALPEKRRRVSMFASNEVEFLDINLSPSENKVSPIKIVGGCSVVRLSMSTSKKHSHQNKPQEINTNCLTASPLRENNTKSNVTPNSRVATARRNLNLSLENGANNTGDSECLNYSIVANTDNTTNDIKLKLRVSDKRRSTRLLSLEEDEDPLALDKNSENVLAQRKRSLANEVYTPSTNNIYYTPTKKIKESAGGTTTTPSTRRKSILKSATTRLADGTPKRNIQLSNVVEKRIFQNDDIISTPKRSNRIKKTNLNNEESNEDEDYKCKSLLKTPTRGRRSSSKLQAESPSHKTPLTPSQKLKMIRSGEISPTIEKRSTTSHDARKSNLQLARERLHVSVVPKSLPCREKEFDNIYTFLEGKIQDQCGGCMYVSGVPGTGKTATVTGVIRMLQQKVATDELPPFDFLDINGMRLTEPRQAYVQIYKQLTGKTVSWEHAHTLLEKRFTTAAPRRVTTVLLVDELDILCNRRQDVVYNLLDWPTKSTARLVVITIANTMDLPERVLMGKVTSRMGLTRLTFQPYTHKQLQEIVTARLGGSEAFKSDAVQLVARKVAAVSGDARRALDICRRATEIADQSSTSKGVAQQCVNMLHVQQALAEMIASAKVQSIKNCSRIEQIFLQAVVAEVTRTGVEETTFSGVYAQIETIAGFMGATVPAPGRALRVCSKLGSERLIICEHSRNDIFQKILLNVSMDDVHYALRVSNNID